MPFSLVGGWSSIGQQTATRFLALFTTASTLWRRRLCSQLGCTAFLETPPTSRSSDTPSTRVCDTRSSFLLPSLFLNSRLIIVVSLDESLNLITDPRWFDINAITGVLKLYFRELQEPLLTFALFDPLIACCSKIFIYFYSSSCLGNSFVFDRDGKLQ